MGERWAGRVEWLFWVAGCFLLCGPSQEGGAAHASHTTTKVSACRSKNRIVQSSHLLCLAVRRHKCIQCSTPPTVQHHTH